MLRYLGIPARVAAGFTSGNFDEDERRWTVADTNAHTWVEVWFDGYGWLPFDPTPGRGRLRAEYTASSLFFDASGATAAFAGGAAALGLDILRNRLGAPRRRPTTATGSVAPTRASCPAPMRPATTVVRRSETTCASWQSSSAPPSCCWRRSGFSSGAAGARATSRMIPADRRRRARRARGLSGRSAGRAAAERDSRRAERGGTQSAPGRCQQARGRARRGPIRAADEAEQAARRARGASRRSQDDPAPDRHATAIAGARLRPLARSALSLTLGRIVYLEECMSETYDLFQQGRSHPEGRAARATVASRRRRNGSGQGVHPEALGIAYFRIQRYDEAEASSARCSSSRRPTTTRTTRSAQPGEARQGAGGERPLQAREFLEARQRAVRRAHQRPRIIAACERSSSASPRRACAWTATWMGEIGQGPLRALASRARTARTRRRGSPTRWRSSGSSRTRTVGSTARCSTWGRGARRQPVHPDRRHGEGKPTELLRGCASPTTPSDCTSRSRSLRGSRRPRRDRPLRRADGGRARERRSRHDRALGAGRRAAPRARRCRAARCVEHCARGPARRSSRHGDRLLLRGARLHSSRSPGGGRAPRRSRTWRSPQAWLSRTSPCLPPPTAGRS